MKTVVKDYVTRFEKNHKRRNRFIAMFLCLSLLTSLVVNRELAGTGIAATADYICGQEEHTHDQSCYELVCGLEGENQDLDFAALYENESLGTLEAANAYEEQLNAYNEQLSSQQSESSEGEELYSEAPVAPVHVHDASCYKLVCDITPHVHSAECLVKDIDDNNANNANSINSETSEDENSVNSESGENGENAINAVSEDGESSEDSEVSAQDLDFDKDDTIDENEHNSHSMIDVATSLNFTLQKLNGNQWNTLNDGAEITDGDTIKLQLNYTIPHSVVSEEAFIITYDIPSGFNIPSEETGYVSGTIGGVTMSGTSAEDSWGIYKVTTDGHISIAFNSKFFATNDDFSGGLTVQGKAKNTSSGESTVIQFVDDGPKYNIITKKEASDISVKKTASKVVDGKITYTVTASSKNGTDGVVNIEDTISTQGLNSITIGNVNVVDGNGNAVANTPVINTYKENDNAKGTLKLELPKLDAGGSYTITYTVDVSDGKEHTNGYQYIGNSVVAKDGKDWKGQDQTGTKIQDRLIQKSGAANDTKTGIVWTITVNPDRSEKVSGDWSLSDQLNGTLIDWSKVTGLKVTKTDANWAQSDITETFKADGYNKITVEPGCNYVITYTVPVTAEDGETVTQTNKVVVDVDDNEYDAEGEATIKPAPEFPSKNAGSNKPISGTTQRQQQWSLTLNPKAGSTSSIVINDKLYNENNLADDSVHWTTLEQLNKYFNDNKNSLEYTASIVAYDKDGNTVTDNSSKVVSFTLTLKPKTSWSGKKIEPIYYSIFETKQLNDGDTVTVNNEAENEGGVSHDANASYTKKSDFGKYMKDGDNYVNGTISIDYSTLSANDKKLTYRIYLKPDSTDEITVTDTLPEGMTLSESDVSVLIATSGPSSRSDWSQAGTSWNGYDITAEGNKPTVIVSEENVLSVTLPAGRPSAMIDTDNVGFIIEYTVTVTDEYWDNDKNNNKTYTNVAKWGDKTSEVDADVVRKVETLQKVGEQVLDKDGKPTNSVRYWVIINPIGDTLNDGNPINLTDKLTTDSSVKVSVDLSKVQLYSYDKNNADNHYIGSPIDSDVFTSSYDDSTKTFNLTIPDGTAMVLSYVYTIEDMSGKASVSFSNSVTLEGKTTINKENKVEVKEASSSSYVTKTNVLTIVKVDEDRYQKPLAGAEFDVYQYSDSTWSKVNESSLVTNDKGTTSFSLKDIKRDTLYYLQETKAPEGYSLSDKKYYFVPLENGKAVDTWVSANSTLMNAEGITKSDIIFIEYNSYGTVYVPNKLTTLQVKKLWFDYDGNEVSGTKDIEVQLYQNFKHLEYKTVTVKVMSAGFASETGTVEYQVSPGTEFTLGTSDYWQNVDYKMGETVTLVNHEGGKTSYSVGVINEDTTVYVAGVAWNIGTGNISATYTKPQWVTDESVPYGNPITLSKSNSYTYKWENLPTATDGKEIYYTVKEITDLGSSYNVTYVNNTGVQTGVITVNNKKTTKSEPYSLPNTGGCGTTPYLFSGLAIMAASLTVIYLKRRKGEGKA